MTNIARLALRAPGVLTAQSNLPWASKNVICYSNDAKLSVEKKKPKIIVDRGPFASQLDYRSRLQFNAPPLPFALSGIICTIGPATNKPEMLLKLIESGMRIVRLNFSHGTHEYHCQTIEAARQAIKMYECQIGAYKPVAIALDTKGPEIRTGQLEGSNTTDIDLKPGDKIKLTTNKTFEKKGNKDVVYVDYATFDKLVKPGNLIYVDDGLIALLVKEIVGSDVVCEVANGGKLGSRKGINLPGIPVDLPSVSEKDKEDLKFGVKQDVDIIFASFIRNAKAIEEVRGVLGPDGKHIKIISKIENQQGLENIDEIIKASDGIMVARGDMGIEIETEDVVLAQKCLIAKCNKVGKPVICATQMLESMITKPRPTRAEAGDVGNAVIDGADCVMLSGETAKGKYPVECVKCMAKICAKMENTLWYEQIQNDIKNVMKQKFDNISSITSGITEIASASNAKAIVIASHSPIVPQLVSQFRPRCPIVFLTGRSRVARQSLLFRGIYPIVPEIMCNGCNHFPTILTVGIDSMARMGIVNADKPMTLMIVNALQAERVTFRLLLTKKKSQEALYIEAEAAQARSLRTQAKKIESRDSVERFPDVVSSPEKCKERKQTKKSEKPDPKKNKEESVLKKCMEILKKTDKKNKDDDTCS